MLETFVGVMDLDFLLEKVVYQILQRNNFSNRQWTTKERQDAREPGLDSKLGSSGISLFNRSAITWMSLSGISRVSMLSAPCGRLSWTRMGSCSACKDFSAFLGYWTSQKSNTLLAINSIIRLVMTILWGLIQTWIDYVWMCLIQGKL